MSNPLCRVCKTAYKSFITFNDGKKVPLFNQQAKAPYISFVVVTRHETADELFNSKYQLSFNNEIRQNDIPQLYIGRSTECDLILDYRTISGWHGVIKFHDHQFIYQDLRSSNGTLVYIRQPVELPCNAIRTFRLGRTLVTLLHKSRNLKKDKSSNGVDEEKVDAEDSDLESLINLCKWPSETTSKDLDAYTQHINKLSESINKNEDINQINDQSDMQIGLENANEIDTDSRQNNNHNNQIGAIIFDESGLSDEAGEEKELNGEHKIDH